MKMLLNKNRLTTERQQRAWSQTQLAEVSCLSLRTIQRIEKNGKASLESVKALASVYNLKITDLSIINPKEVSLPVLPQPAIDNFYFLSRTAKVLTTTVFILSTLVLLFMLWTNIPPAWIGELRSGIFSDRLSASILNIIRTSLAIIFTLTIAIIIGLLFDAIRDDGLYHYVKSSIQSGKLSVSRSYAKMRQTIISYGKFLAKPLMISGVIIIISGTGIYLTMEDYQKNNMARFVQKF